MSILVRLAALAMPVLLALLVTMPARAGDQRYEPLAESVRSALSAAVSDAAVPLLNFANSDDARGWLNEMSARLAARVADRRVRTDLLKSVHYEAVRAGLDPQLVLGVMEVESGFRKYAVSHAGARGFMQVMPFWIGLIGRKGDNLFHLRTNLRYGCVILRHYLDIEKGDYFRALGRYNGSLGQPEYPRLVLGAWKGKWQFAGATH